MFELHSKTNGDKVLKWVKRPRLPGERGLWIEIAHESDKGANSLVELNRKAGMQIEKDDKGFYRALILKD